MKYSNNIIYRCSISHYIKELNQIYKKGNATEHTYRHVLQSLIEVLTTELVITNEPKRIKCGAPDYIITKNEIPLGYIEAKDLGTDLNSSKNKEQFDRYKQSLNNLIITDYINFILFENGQLVTSVSIATYDGSIISQNTTQFDAFIALINRFVGYIGNSIQSSVELSKIMAVKARLLAQTIENAVTSNSNFPIREDLPTGKLSPHDDDKNSLYAQLQGFREILISNMSPKQFADIYAQTIAYGMFAANINKKDNEFFTRSKTAYLIPESNPFLRNLFDYIAGFKLDERIRWIVDDLANLFNYVDINIVKKEFYTDDWDPIIHFYETFLSEYDPALRKSRGVWFTPKPIVQFIVKAVDDILKTEFAITQGLADTSKISTTSQPLKNTINQQSSNGVSPLKNISNQRRDTVATSRHRIQILDPATGTGTFLTEVIEQIYQNFKNQQGLWQNYVSQHLLPRINGFEILMASYAMAHLMLDMVLQKTGYRASLSERHNQRLRIYLTNSLDESIAETKIPLIDWLTEEANEASKIKNDVPVMVVLGNPPYSGESQNSGKWINRLLNDYKKESSGTKLQEKNPKWINDDYVKFIRYGQHFIEKNGEGILAFINNHSFLDNPTFRGMRYSLLKTFEHIYIIDLHGNAKKKETTPDGSKDENVFDIQQGVSINIFVKKGNSNFPCHCEARSNRENSSTKKLTLLADIFHYDIYGKRSEKYNFLQTNNIKTVLWKKLEPTEPYYFFVPKDFSRKAEYERWFSLQELFPLNSVGVVTAKDTVLINYSKKELLQNIKNNLYIIPEDKYVKHINYRPFDNRFIYYDTKKLERARANVMQHFIKGENLGLVINRPAQGGAADFTDIFITSFITDQSIFSAVKRSPYICPLYLYPDAFNPEVREPNLNPAIVVAIEQRSNGIPAVENKSSTTGMPLLPINIFDYIYGVLHNPDYREKYKEFLQIDFPRVPYPEDADQFWQYVNIGSQLRKLHLLEGVESEEGIADYPVAGSDVISSVNFLIDETFRTGKCDLLNGKVYINDTQYFNNVPLEVWKFYIGGYPPAQKWLKDRKGMKLEYDNIRHYQKIIVALTRTCDIIKSYFKQ